MTVISVRHEPIAVGLGEIKVARSSGQVVAYGLGSCVGVVAYDPVAQAGGIAHVMLPEGGATRASELPGRYADDGIDNLFASLETIGAEKSRLKVSIGGGAQMLTAPGLTDKFNIGSRNVEKVREVLRLQGIRIRGDSTGGHAGRTVVLDVATGEVTVRKVGDKEHVSI